GWGTGLSWSCAQSGGDHRQTKRVRSCRAGSSGGRARFSRAGSANVWARRACVLVSVVRLVGLAVAFLPCGLGERAGSTSATRQRSCGMRGTAAVGRECLAARARTKAHAELRSAVARRTHVRAPRRASTFRWWPWGYPLDLVRRGGGRVRQLEATESSDGWRAEREFHPPRGRRMRFRQRLRILPTTTKFPRLWCIS